jgi:asparagine synthase (glutamine-hydrolysing)
VVAVTHVGADPCHDDAAWAQQAAASVDVEHLPFDPAQLGPCYANIADARQGQDSPFARVRNTTRNSSVAGLLVERGSRAHVAGHGGDEVLQAPRAYLHTLWRTHPRIATDHLQGWRARDRWPLGAALRAFADRRGYRSG